MPDLLFVTYMGGPDSLEAINPFLKNLFSDREIIDFKVGDRLQNFIASKIADKRSKKVRADYEKVGGASPQIIHLNNLLEKVSEIYKYKYNKKLKTLTGMCYYKPFIEESIKVIQEELFDNIYVMTMYPQYSYATAGVCIKRFNNALNIVPSKSNYKIIPYWHLNKDYNECIKKRIDKVVESWNLDVSDCHILFSAHSLPEYTIEKGDVYLKHLDEQIKYLMKNYLNTDYSLSFQSRTGPMKWIGPETNTILNDLFEKNIDNIIVVPISFVSDHVETLVELDDNYIKNIRAKGINIQRIESLNSSDDFAEAIISIIRGENGKI